MSRFVSLIAPSMSDEHIIWCDMTHSLRGELIERDVIISADAPSSKVLCGYITSAEDALCVGFLYHFLLKAIQTFQGELKSPGFKVFRITRAVW
ncbi:hypothetical protein [Alicyclobacillus mengziensis]|uniref:hypothetical protein n=1 Tax=Alicyclobacillus mengziensis TaxID=2931921 RepID=UPI0020133FB1|nr:hypothetical protein [Alicyclobacillus mengziensis]